MLEARTDDYGRRRDAVAGRVPMSGPVMDARLESLERRLECLEKRVEKARRRAAERQFDAREAKRERNFRWLLALEIATGVVVVGALVIVLFVL